MEDTKQLVKSNGQITQIKLPSLSELIQDDEGTIKQNALMVLLNQEPPKQWVKSHPIAKVKKNGIEVPLSYLPVERIEYLLSHIYGKWWVEVLSVQLIANSVQVTVRLFVRNPITGEVEHTDGVGAVGIQTDKGASASDWSKMKHSGVQIAAPAAKTYAMKDAAESLGKLFGKDLGRADEISYNDLLKPTIISLSDLRELYELKKDALTDEEITDAERILNENETKSFNKLHKHLMTV